MYLMADAIEGMPVQLQDLVADAKPRVRGCSAIINNTFDKKHHESLRLLSIYGLDMGVDESDLLCLPPPAQPEERNAVYAPCKITQDRNSLTIYVSAPGVHVGKSPSEHACASTAAISSSSSADVAGRRVGEGGGSRRLRVCVCVRGKGEWGRGLCDGV